MTCLKSSPIIAIAALAGLSLSACDRGPADTAAPAAAEAEAPAAPNPTAAFRQMAEDHAARFLQTAPETATDLGVSEGVAGAGYLSRLGGYGFEAHHEARLLNESFLQELRGFDRDELGADDRVTYDILKNAYDSAARRNQFDFGGATAFGASLPNSGDAWAISPYFLTQLTGPHIYLPRMLQTQHPLDSADHVSAYLARLDEFGRAFDEIIETIGSDAAYGIVPPRFVIEGAIGVVDGFTALPPGENPLVKTLNERMASIPGLNDEEKVEFSARAAAAVENVVYPAYARLGAQLESMLQQSDDDAGVWRLGPEGAAFYQMALTSYGGGGRTGDEIHDLGLSEVARITEEMDMVLKSIGYADGTVAGRMVKMSEEADNLYPNTDEGRDALLQSLRGDVAGVMQKAPLWFGTVPSQQVEVRRIPVSEQNSSPGGYYTGPSLDGARPGIYWINLKNTADNPKHSLKSLTYHEAVPGHHFQASFQRAIPNMPLMRNMLGYSEYAEGWALYAEALAKEMGMYENDPRGDLGRLQAELFRAARLVVDTGLHAKQWTREEAIDYIVKATGQTRASMTREVERYAAIPGQACAYKLGMIKIQELRATAEDELGPDFDIREFHDVVLSVGEAPLPVLDGVVTKWISTKKGA